MMNGNDFDEVEGENGKTRFTSSLRRRVWKLLECSSFFCYPSFDLSLAYCGTDLAESVI